MDKDVDKLSNSVNIFDYDTGFLCTYHLMNDDVEDDTMSDNLYKIQLAQALRMNMDIARVIAGYGDELRRFLKNTHI